MCIYKLRLGVVAELEVLGVVGKKALQSGFPEFWGLVELDVFDVVLS